jgi:hypothetical protein|eukprot:Transcript_16500.p1 GENE.Transcript_16500~~Transcript_16500.p1  ORF type:complete len:308 (+),score=41.76 Transcript_16500:111-1034(+)
MLGHIRNETRYKHQNRWAKARDVLVASLFIRLPRASVKHVYAFQYKPFRLAVDVPAPYEMWGSATEVEQIQQARAARNKTTVTHPVDFDFVCRLLAQRLGVTIPQLLRAASAAVTQQHCPSEKLVVVWLAKPLIVELAMQAHPERERFAWVDAAFNAYRYRRRLPARPPPWDLFWPERGLAFRKLPGGCHNEVRPGANHSSCPIATFFYGSRGAWNRFTGRYLERVRELVVAPTQGMLCTEQDVMADVLQGRADEQLGEEFTTSDASGWGWKQAQRVSVRCGRGSFNLGNTCVPERAMGSPGFDAKW